ncbi:MAG: DUF4389 domain-containing protein [bacterium]
MGTHAASSVSAHVVYPVRVFVDPCLSGHNRLTTFFRPLLAIPQLILVGGPLAAAATWSGGGDSPRYEWGSGGGVLGIGACVITMIAWFGILFTGRYPGNLATMVGYYLRWRVRAVAYVALLRDEYPPFGDGPYAALVDIPDAAEPRDRLSVGFRLILAIPHIFCVTALSMVWAFTTIIAWFSILFTGRYPRDLYQFGVGVLRWNTRVEAYLLLLTDQYPPFSLV